MPLLTRHKHLWLPVKGTMFYHIEEALEQGLAQGSHQIELVPEPDNEYDPYAVIVYSLTPTQKRILLGYIPRTHSKHVSYLIKYKNPISILSYTFTPKIHIDLKIGYPRPLWQRWHYPLWYIWQVLKQRQLWRRKLKKVHNPVDKL